MDQPTYTEKDDASLEKGSGTGGKQYADPAYVVAADDRFHFDASDLDKVQRRLSQRHVQM